MKNFDTTRFMNYGRYDSAINKSYYRNMSLVAIFVILGIALIGFLGRWVMWKMSGQGEFATDPMTSYKEAPMTAALLMGATSMLALVFAGCTFHNLRTKQSRIFELTIPATKLEKYIWHTLVSVVGGLVVCFIGLALADGMNALLNLLVYPIDAQSSLICKVLEGITLSSMRGYSAADDNALTAFTLAITTYAFFNVGFYVLVNSFKYRFNILISYGIQQGVFMILYIIMIVIGISGGFEGIGVEGGAIIGYSTTGLCTLLGCLCFWGAYKRYGKAVITSKLNK